MRNQINILLVEDNEGDIMLTVEALRQAKVRKILKVVRDGAEAIAFLNKEGKYVNEATPDIVLLDINLPKLTGKDVLVKIKSDNALKKIPVVMLTTSSLEEDVLYSYSNYANCYITKPVDIGKFMIIVQSLEYFWIATAELPN